jgi:nicotinamide-nucleotide amidase
MLKSDLLLDVNETLFPEVLLRAASDVLEAARRSGIRIATAETVTSGLVGACLTSVAGASEIFERSYVLYHSSAKATGLGVPESVSAAHGAVSAEVTRGLAQGLFDHSQAGAVVAITGYAGPGGGNARDPVGTIYLAAALRNGAVSEERHAFPGSRDNVRLAAVHAALKLLHGQIIAS